MSAAMKSIPSASGTAPLLQPPSHPGRIAATVSKALLLICFMVLTASPGVAQDIDWLSTKELVRMDFPEAPQLSVSELAAMLGGTGQQPLLIDVRDAKEYAVSHLPGAVHAQGEAIIELVRAADPGRPVVLYCSVGYRSSRETEKLMRAGFGNVVNLEGSIFEWANDGQPLVQGPPDSQRPTDVVHPFNKRWGTLLDADRRSYRPRAEQGD